MIDKVRLKPDTTIIAPTLRTQLCLRAGYSCAEGQRGAAHRQTRHAVERLAVPLHPGGDDLALARLYGSTICRLSYQLRALLALERKAPQGGRLDELGDGHPVTVISGRQEPRGGRDGHADVTHLVRTDLVGRVLVRVVVAIGEVPVEQARECRRW